MEWFRLYNEFAADAKVQSMSEAMQRRLIMLLCLRSGETLQTLNEDELAFALRIDEEELTKTKEIFIKKGFIGETWELLNWNKRQFVSDNSTGRVTRYRDKRKAMGLTSNGYTKHIETVMQRDGHACVYCNSQDKLCVDHAYPVILGGTDDVDNLVCACKSCNSGKAGRTPAQAGYTFYNKETEKIWNGWMLRNHVTVTETPQNRTDTEQIQNRVEKKNHVAKYSALDDLISRGVEKQVAHDWLAVRKAKKSASTKTAIDGVLREIEKAGMSPDDGIRICCVRGWAGFNPAWLHSNGQSANGVLFENAKDRSRREANEALTGRKHDRNRIIDI